MVNVACAAWKRRFGRAVWPVFVALAGCAGRSQAPTPAGNGGEGADIATGAVGGMTTSPSTSYRTLDDMDHAEGSYPVGLEPPAFYWTTSTSGGIGNWFVMSVDGTVSDAAIDEILPPRGESRKACHVSGAGYARGLDLFAQLNHPTSRPADLSAFLGIAFWARLTSETSKLVAAVGDGRTFFAAEDDQSPLPSQTFTVSDHWQHFELSFQSIGADPSHVVSLEFVGGEGGEPFELWVDDLAFICSGACP